MRQQAIATFLFFVIGLCMIGINAQYLSSAVTRDGYQMWEPSLNTAIQSVLDQLNGRKSIDEVLQFSKIDREGTKVAHGVMYTVGLEMDAGNLKNARYEVSFLQPSEEYRPLWSALPLPESRAPSSTPLSTALATANEHNHYTPQSPELSMTLRGPLEVYLHNRAVELHIRTPREVDVGSVDKIVIANGVNVTVSGFSELSLKEPIALLAPPVSADNKLLVDVKNTPKLTFFGRHVDISNATATEPLKIKKRGVSEIEIVSATETPMSSRTMPFELPLNDSRLQTLQYAMRQLADSVHAVQPPVLRRLFSTKLEAVTSFFIPLEVKSPATGETYDWEVVVAQGANVRVAPKIISLEKKRIITELSYNEDLANNGTLAAAVQDFIASRPEYKLHL